MKIAFFMPNMKQSIDYSNPEQLNPGIGGTQFMIWTISYYLKKMYDDLEVYLFAETIDKLPKNLKLIEAKDELECIRLCKSHNIDILIMRGPISNKKIFEIIDRLQVKTIMWSHNFETYKSAKWASKTENIVRNVCVSYEQYDWLRDNDLRYKSQVIYNSLDFSNYNKINEKVEDQSICYIGNLYPNSGFDILADTWPTIIKKVPTAKLYIIGGNNLYKSGPKLRFNESKKYQKKIDKIFRNGGIFSENVHFLGVLGGADKLKVMSKSKIGIANITPAGETFGIAAVEFQALQVPVVSFEKYGLRETVSQNSTGVLVRSKRDFANAIIELLTNEDKYNSLRNNGREYVVNKFSIEDACKKWYELFQDVINNSTVKMYNRDACFNYDKKSIVLLNFKIKSMKLLNKLPSILLYKYVNYVTIRLFKIIKP